MANYTHVKILSQGVYVWNRWRHNRPYVSPDLSGANLSGRNLTGIDFSNTNLDGADFTYANMRGANLANASIEGAKGLR